MGLTFVYLIDWMTESNISDYVRCLTRIQCIVFVVVYDLNPISHICRFHEILHKNCNISRLQILWESQHLMVVDFMRYVSHRNHNMSLLQNHMFHISWDDEILHQNHHISWLHISWDISKDNCLRRSYGPRDTVSDPLLAHCVTTADPIHDMN